MALHPTLWRTCRVLAGPTRLRLLRRVIARPGLTVQQLAMPRGSANRAPARNCGACSPGA